MDEIRQLRARRWHNLRDEVPQQGESTQETRDSFEPVSKSYDASVCETVIAGTPAAATRPFDWGQTKTDQPATETEADEALQQSKQREQVKREADRIPEYESIPTPTQPETKERAAQTDAKLEPSEGDVKDERTCRFCFGGPEDEDASGKLISPCKCRGTAKWIHLGCLQAWRLNSAKSESYYRCDQCLYEYSFRRTQVAALIQSRVSQGLLTCFLFLVATFVGGFVAKLLIYLYPGGTGPAIAPSFGLFSWYVSPIDTGTDLMLAASNLVPQTPRTLREVFTTVDIYHFLVGLISLGALGLIQLLYLVGGGGIFGFRNMLWRSNRGEGGTRGRGGDLTQAAIIMLVLVGCGKVLYEMWKTVNSWTKRFLEAAGDRILEVND